MNKQRRNAIRKIYYNLRDIQDLVDGLRDEEQEAYDNLPEGLQMSERGEAMEEAIENLDSAYNDLDSVLDYLEEAMN